MLILLFLKKIKHVEITFKKVSVRRDFNSLTRLKLRGIE